tara:strand:+ start:689 stop:1849 length:1161 start_codon:yes stop_codon:yes gene_type:complete
LRPLLIAANSSWYINHYRSKLLEEVKNNWGYPISLAPIDGSSKYLERNTFFIPWNTNRKDDFNIISLIIALVKILFLVRALKPTLIHSHTLKTNLLISIASSIFGIKTVLSFAGLGRFADSKGFEKLIFNSILKIIIFISKIERFNKWQWRINNQRTFFIFQNPKDKKLIEKMFSNAQKNNIVTILGSGIPARYFSTKSEKIKQNDPHNFFYCGRLLKSKGIKDFIKLAELNKKDKFHVFGEIDLSSKDSLKKNDFKNFKHIKNLHFHGNKKDPLINKKITNKVLIVPSQYGEGLPRSIGEALALKLNVIASKKSCCGIFNNEMIYVVDKNNINEYMKAIKIYKMEFESDKINVRRDKGYYYAKQMLSEEKIVKQTINTYKILLGK